MNCYDCATAGLDNPTVATCVECGAGLCFRHAIVTEHHLTRIRVINRLESIDPPARLMQCGTCAAAHDAAAHGHRVKAG